MSVVKGVAENSEEALEAVAPPRRLCNEIQLFDLCDLDTCRYKDDRFCTNAELVAAFERISDAEVVRRESVISEELEEDDDAFDSEYDEGFDEEPGDDAGYEDDY